MPYGQPTSLTEENKNKESIRTIVPASTFRQYDLKEGDCLRWILEAVKKNEYLVGLESARANKESTRKVRVGNCLI